MNIPVVICLAAVLLVACTRRSNAEPSEVEKGGVLIDVRTADEFNEGHLANAINIPYTEIADKIAAHVKNKTDRIVVYCRSGNRSSIAKKTLEKLGYTEVVNAGSYRTLKAAEEKRAKAQKTTTE